MRRVLGIIFVCSALATQSFAGQEIGRQAVRTALKDGSLIKDLAATHGVLPTAINHSNIGKFMQGKQLVGKVRDALIAGVAALVILTPGAADAELKPLKPAPKTITAIDKSAKAAKIDDTAERQFKQVVGISGSWITASKADDSLLVGANYHANYKYKLSSFSAKAQGIVNNIKRTGTDNWDHHNDYTARANYTQALEIDGREIMPIGIIDGGASHFGNSRRLADLTGSIGIQAQGKYLDRDVYVQLRAGGGGLGNAKYVDGDYEDLDWESVVVFGVTAKLPWVTLGDLVGAPAGSIANFFPLIPGGDLEYSRYYKANDWDIATDMLRGSLTLTKELSLKGEWNKRTDEDGHYKVMANLELTDMFAK
ncbi:MAG: hypothetical protein OYH77_07065 [Pseudomonadota bacterium]|nr:hypothetical protein [Pseudomonadota bacterium]